MMNSSSRPDSSKAVIPPNRAPVSDRALSMTSCSTVSGSRLSLTRRLASLNRVSRSRSSVISRRCSSASCIFPPWPDCGRPWPAVSIVPDRPNHHNTSRILGLIITLISHASSKMYRVAAPSGVTCPERLAYVAR